MRHTQIVVFERDGQLARLVEPLAERRRWQVRESRQRPACIDLVRDGGPSVLVLKVGRDLVHEMQLLEQIHETLPDIAVIAVAEQEDAELAGLVYDLGAAFALFPPLPRALLASVVERLLDRASDRPRLAPPPVASEEPVDG